MPVSHVGHHGHAPQTRSVCSIETSQQVGVQTQCFLAVQLSVPPHSQELHPLKKVPLRHHEESCVLAVVSYLRKPFWASNHLSGKGSFFVLCMNGQYSVEAFLKLV
mmetsp:Transcript_17961/g.50216  ORF Transcript_17961/g.50216 Transcript_17961/m.50216 type:complete len:106 (-) Transcript_17961:121-438(-)